MKISFWGVRGSEPRPEPNQLRYGGNTNCLVVQGKTNHYFVLDSGTGLARFSTTLNPAEAYHATMLLTHLHLFHIIGFQFSPLTYSRNSHMRVLGPRTKPHSLVEVFDHILSPIYSPVYGLDNLIANVEFEEIDKTVRQVEDITIISIPFAHTEETDSWGYRLQNETGAIVYITDAVVRDESGQILQAAKELAANANILVMGADEPHEYGEGLELARLAHVKHLVFTHHPIDATDEDLDRFQSDLREKNPDLKISLAVEGMTLEA